MALTVTAGGARGVASAAVISSNTSRMVRTEEVPRRCQIIFSFSPRTLHIASAKKFSPRTGRFDSRNRRNNTATEDEEKKEEDQLFGGSRIERTGPENSVLESVGDASGAEILSIDGKPMPKLPGAEPNFWEGPQWDAFGFFVQYMWAFGILFSIVAIGVAVSTYNEGAADFKETPAYRESIKSEELLEEPEANSDVFESNPTEVAPSLD